MHAWMHEGQQLTENLEGNDAAAIVRHVGRDRVSANPVRGPEQPEVESVRVATRHPARHASADNGYAARRGYLSSPVPRGGPVGRSSSDRHLTDLLGDPGAASVVAPGDDFLVRPGPFDQLHSLNGPAARNEIPTLGERRRFIDASERPSIGPMVNR